ncbi:MAG: phage terminase large subunit [Cyanobium usitatum Tobar12.5m-G36]|nr:phage terminase large subunit [Cyanobium usitatum Tobar12.5m-G36]
MAGLLLDPATDRWADWGLLDVADPNRSQIQQQGQQSFRDFIVAAYPSYAFHTWAERLIALLQRVADGQLNRLIVCCPPRLGKSLLVSKLFPAYWVSRYPTRFCAIASYSAELAYAHSREARHYYRAVGHPLSKDSTAVGNWLTPERGGCIAAGVRGPFTGKGYALGIIDDPYKGPEDANSASQRQKLIEWFQSVWLTRAEPGVNGAAAGAQVVVLTRWHQDDLIGWLLDQESGDAPQAWHVLNLPATCEPLKQQLQFPATCTVEPDWRQTGEPLCPERFPLSDLEQIRIRAGSYWWNALYQQRPSPAEGLLFQRQWVRHTLPAQLQSGHNQQKPYAPLVLSCDLSFKGGEGNDYCGFVLLGLHADTPVRHAAADARAQGLQLHRSAALLPPPAPSATQAATGDGPGENADGAITVLWSQHQRLDLPGVVKFLTSTLTELSRSGLTPDAVLIEDAANGPAVCQLLQRQIPGLIAVRPVGSKVSRAHAVAPLLEAGQLGFCPGNEDLITELLGFPNAAHDDLVDAFCQGGIWLQNRHWRGQGKAPPRPLLFSR